MASVLLTWEEECGLGLEDARENKSVVRDALLLPPAAIEPARVTLVDRECTSGANRMCRLVMAVLLLLLGATSLLLLLLLLPKLWRPGLSAACSALAPRGVCLAAVLRRLLLLMRAKGAPREGCRSSS